jgi:hypothetical protein
MMQHITISRRTDKPIIVALCAQSRATAKMLGPSELRECMGLRARVVMPVSPRSCHVLREDSNETKITSRRASICAVLTSLLQQAHKCIINLLYLGSLLLLAYLQASSAYHPAMVKMDMARNSRPSQQKRKPQAVTLTNTASGYCADSLVRTPPQHILVSLNFGSSDTWIFGSALVNCDACAGGAVDPNMSSTGLVTGVYSMTYVPPGPKVVDNYIRNDLGHGGARI